MGQFILDLDIRIGAIHQCNFILNFKILKKKMLKMFRIYYKLYKFKAHIWKGMDSLMPRKIIYSVAKINRLGPFSKVEPQLAGDMGVKSALSQDHTRKPTQPKLDQLILDSA